MDLPVIAGLLVLLLLGITLFVRAYTRGMRFGDRLESRRAAQTQGGDTAEDNDTASAA